MSTESNELTERAPEGDTPPMHLPLEPPAGWADALITG
jgi:hypothetical protein